MIFEYLPSVFTHLHTYSFLFIISYIVNISTYFIKYIQISKKIASNSEIPRIQPKSPTQKYESGSNPRVLQKGLDRVNLAELGALAYIDVRKRSQGSDFARYRFFWDALFLLKDDSKFKKRLSEFHKSKYLSDIKYVIHPSLPILVDAQIIEIAKVKGINKHPPA